MRTEKKIIRAKKGSRLTSAIQPEAISTGQAKHSMELKFQSMVQGAVQKAFRGMPLECHYSEPGKEADFALHGSGRRGPDGRFFSPDIQLANSNVHLPIDVKWLSAGRGKKLSERFKQRLVPQLEKYVNGKLFVRLQMDEFIEHDSPLSEKAIMITNAVPSEIMVENAKMKNVHTLSIHELESLVGHVPGLALIDRRKAERILKKEKYKIMEHFGLRDLSEYE